MLTYSNVPVNKPSNMGFFGWVKLTDEQQRRNLLFLFFDFSSTVIIIRFN